MLIKPSTEDIVFINVPVALTIMEKCFVPMVDTRTCIHMISNADHTRMISKSIFVTNFPDNTSSKDLWKLCQDYGTMVDVYIPNRKSKARKRFAFVHFIKVENIDRLVGNLCTLWIGRMHLHANVVRFERSPIQASRSTSSARPNHIGASSFATVLKGNNTPVNASEAPAMVIDDSCVNVKVVYLGGLWVMFELESLKSKAKFMQHVGVASWFSCLCNAQSDFVSRERIVWVDIAGVPLHAWLRATFTKIDSKWGEVMDLEESKDDLAKELFAWSSMFNEVNEVEYCMDDEYVQGTNEDKGEVSNKVQPNPESDDEGVSNTYFGEIEENLGNEHNLKQPMNDKEKSQDPFNFYDLLRKRDGGVDTLGSDISIPYPPGFTPEKLNNNADVHEVKDMITEPSECRSEGLCSRVLEEVQHTDDLLSFGVRSNGHMLKKRGSVLEVLDEMIKVRQTMGYTVEGLGSKAKKDWTRELIGKHKVNLLSIQETKIESISKIDVKILWGNSNFEYLFSEAIGNSGRILCTWDPNIFSKEQHILSDNFVALFGTWILTKTKLLMISIYAHQPRTEKRSLWNYIMSLVTRWQGDSIVIGDFNEVRSADERMGSIFNIKEAADFNDFIFNSGHLSDHRPILLRDVIADYGATPFRLYHSWLTLSGFEQLVIHTWNSTVLEDSNGMVRFKKKLQALKKAIREWVAVYKQEQTVAIEGDENSKFFHGVINRKRANLAIRGIMVDGEWVDDPRRVKKNFALTLLPDFKLQVVSTDEIRTAVWACGENKSPGPNGFTFEFFHKFWDTTGPDLCLVVEWFFDHGSFSRGCNSLFIALIPKVQDLKFVNDYRPISLIGSFYKVVTKILALWLSSVIVGHILDVQTTFLPSRQILDGPFVINEMLSWCTHKKQHAMIFKVDFAKAYDYPILRNGFCLSHGSLTAEFQFHCGLKQGDPLAPYLFFLVMESLYLSFSRVVDAGIFKGIKIDNSIMISHLYYVDDVVFVGEWSDDNLSSIMHVLHCFSLASGLKINVKKSHLLVVGISNDLIVAVASTLGCSIKKTPFKYLGVTVGGNMSNISAWNDIISKLNSRLSK
nr:RNA-directed DNA polymerase, eukaryota [Tanacetum cinerariifolium]